MGERDGGIIETAGWYGPVRSDVVDAWSVHAGKRHQVVLYDTGRLVFWSAEPFDNGISVPVDVIEGLIAAHLSSWRSRAPSAQGEGT